MFPDSLPRLSTVNPQENEFLTSRTYKAELNTFFHTRINLPSKSKAGIIKETSGLIEGEPLWDDEKNAASQIPGH